MNNTIFNQNLGGDNNSISSLSFHWSAIFEDGTKINQFENKIEMLINAKIAADLPLIKELKN